MTIENPVDRPIPGMLLSVSAQVKEEAARWRDAAAANGWAVLALPPRPCTQDDYSRKMTSQRTAEWNAEARKSSSFSHGESRFRPS